MKIMLSAGEVSGDIHGAHLVREIKKLRSDIYFFGMGSEKLCAEGVDIKVDIAQHGTIGIFEALPNFFPVYSAYRKMIALMKKEKPEMVVFIDSQGINFPLAAAAKKLGIKTVYYIAPQEWLWGTPRGVEKVAETVDLIVSIFEKEHEIYKKAGGNSVYFGHPLLDMAKPPLSGEETHQSLTIALCPGSRAQEIKNLLPTLLSAGRIILKEFPGAQFLIPAASYNIFKMIFPHIGDFRAKAVIGSSYPVLAASDLAICASGTINLEACLLGTPNIMVYKLSPLTYFVGKYILKIDKKIPHFSMPNILLNEKVIPELVMRNANPQKIAEEAISILKDPLRRDKMKTSFQKLKSKLGQPPILPKIAKVLLM